MKDFFLKLRDELVSVLETRLAFLLLGMGLGSGGDVDSIISMLRGFIGV